MKLLKFYLIIISALLIFICNCTGLFAFDEKELKTNYVLFDSLAVTFSKELFSQTVTGKYKEVNFIITKIPATSMIEKEFANLCIENDIAVTSDSTKSVTHYIQINRFELNYSNHSESNDSLIREINLDAYLTGDNPKYQNYSKFAYKYLDTVSREDIPLLQSNSAQYVNSAIPERKRTFLERTLAPAILVSAAILSVLILFTVRSN